MKSKDYTAVWVHVDDRVFGIVEKGCICGCHNYFFNLEDD